MTKLNISRLDSTTENDTAATLNINTNFENIQKAIENTLSRDGTTPNYMDADLDMNSYRIINVGTAVDDTDAVNYKQFKEEIGEATVAASQAAASAAQAATSAQSALVSSTNAISSVRNAENIIKLTNNLLTETQQYVDNAKVDINAAIDEATMDISDKVSNAENSISTIVSDAEGSITNIAVTEANKAIANAAQEATDIAVAKLQPYVNQAQEDANSAAASMEQAALSATAASNYASNASADADNAAESAGLAANSASEAAIHNFKNKITNCITEIPQDIKLELNNGTLTLKAGSKLYVPNGAGVFDEVVVASDLVNQNFTQSGTVFIRYETGMLFCDWLVSAFSSGSDSSTVTGWYYDTSKNEIKYYNNGVANNHTVGLPLGIATASNGKITSIDQVFNGFGYIGSTIFALPGVKGLIPNGRNTDGSLRSIEFKTTSVFTRTIEGIQNSHEFTIATTGIGINDHTLNEQENYIYNAQGAKLTDRYVAGNITFSQTSPYNVTSFTPKTAFHAVDYNDFKAADANVVHRTGNETITGLKTINTSQNQSLITKSNGIDNSVTPTSPLFSNFIDAYDTKGALLSRVFTTKTTSGANGIAIQAWNGSTNYIIQVLSDGTAQAPSSITHAIGNIKVSTDFQVVSALPSSPIAGVFYFVKE